MAEHTTLSASNPDGAGWALTLSHAILLLNLHGDFCNNTERQYGELIMLLSISEGILHNELSAVLQTAVRYHNPKGY